MVATFLTNFEQTVFKLNVETVYKGLWTRSRLGLVTDLTISTTSLCNFSVLVKMSAHRKSLFENWYTHLWKLQPSILIKMSRNQRRLITETY